MWDLAVREDDYQAAETMVRRMKSPPLSMRVLLTYARVDSAGRNAIFEEARASDSRQSQIGARYVATFLEDFTAADSLARLDLAERRRPPIRVNAQIFLAWLEVARGRWSKAKEAFAAAERMPEAVPLVFQRAMAATLPFLQVPAADLDRLRTELAGSTPGAEAADSNATLSVRLLPQLRLYLLALISSRLGDAASAANYSAELERIATPAEARDVVRGLVRTLRTDRSAQGGTPAAVDDLGDLAIPLELVSVPLFANVREFTLEHARFLRALHLVTSDSMPEALRVIDTGFQGSPAEFVYLAALHEQRAFAYLRLGDRQRAIDHYRRFVRLWDSCDPELRGRVEAARAALARLERASG